MKDSIKINEKASSCQIQQCNRNIIQTIKIGNEFSHDKVLDVLLSIQKLSISDEFAKDFGINTEEIKSIIVDTIEMVERKDAPIKIKMGLEKIKGFTERMTGSIVAKGICVAIGKTLN